MDIKERCFTIDNKDSPYINELADDVEVERPLKVEVERDRDLAAWEHSRIIIPLHTFNKILKLGKDATNAWMLYCFYFFKARKDGSNQAYATDNYCRNEKGLGWGKDRFHRTKKLLIDNGLIKPVVRRDENGKITGHYIKVVGMPKARIYKYHNPRNQGTGESQNPRNPEGGFTQKVGNQGTSALSVTNKCLNNNNKDTAVDNSKTILIKSERWGEFEIAKSLYEKYTEEEHEAAMSCLEDKLDVENPAAYYAEILRNGWYVDYVKTPEDLRREEEAARRMRISGEKKELEKLRDKIVGNGGDSGEISTLHSACLEAISKERWDKVETIKQKMVLGREKA